MLSNSKKPILQLGSPDITAESKILLNKKISLLEDKINAALLNPNCSSASSILEIENTLNEAESILREMEVELSSYSSKTKERYNLPFFKSKINSLSLKFHELESYHNNKVYEIGDEDKERLISANREIDESNAKMKESIKLMSGVTQTDKDTMHSLKNQTNSLLNTANLLNEADSYIKKSAKVVNSMINRAMTNKIIMIGIDIMLGLINIILVYYKIKNKFK